MDENQKKVEISFLTNGPIQSDYIREQFQVLIKKFNLGLQQLSKMFDIPINEIENIMNDSITITNEKFEEIEYKITMLNFGFDDFNAKDRVKSILNSLLVEYEITTESLSKIINVAEKELIDFKEDQLLERTIEIEICVNIIMLNFVLHK
ncbi:plasmid maintenance system antidote protein VapI [Lysinibacillus sp. RC46]|uniref:HTH domain-containing protein n=1 Tax=unclassified Lysinibacillus TaxID=2636778 RepID=UPI003515186F